MYCKNCGKEIEDGNVLCAECGVKESIEGNTETVVTEPVREEKAEEISATIDVETEKNTEGQKQTVVNDPKSSDPKSKMAAGLFGIFLGAYGVHNFYLGYMTKAIIQVSVSGASLLLLCCAMFFLPLIIIPILGLLGMQIWGIVEGIMILTGHIATDANGTPLKE